MDAHFGVTLVDEFARQGFDLCTQQRVVEGFQTDFFLHLLFDKPVEAGNMRHDFVVDEEVRVFVNLVLDRDWFELQRLEVGVLGIAELFYDFGDAAFNIDGREQLPGVSPEDLSRFKTCPATTCLTSPKHATSYAPVILRRSSCSTSQCQIPCPS